MYQVSSIKQSRLTPPGWFVPTPAESGFSTVLVIIIASLLLFILWEISGMADFLAEDNYKASLPQPTVSPANCKSPILEALGDCYDLADPGTLPPDL